MYSAASRRGLIEAKNLQLLHIGPLSYSAASRRGLIEADTDVHELDFTMEMYSAASRRGLIEACGLGPVNELFAAYSAASRRGLIEALLESLNPRLVTAYSAASRRGLIEAWGLERRWARCIRGIPRHHAAASLKREF